MLSGAVFSSMADLTNCMFAITLINMLSFHSPDGIFPENQTVSFLIGQKTPSVLQLQKLTDS